MTAISAEFNFTHNTGLLCFSNYIQELESFSGIGVGFWRCGGIKVLSSSSQPEIAKKEAAFFQKSELSNQQITLSVISDKELNSIVPEISGTGFVCDQFSILCSN